MKNLPNGIKWLIIVVVLALLAAMVWAVNDRASRVKMPEPDDSFGIYHTPSSLAQSIAESQAAEQSES